MSKQQSKTGEISPAPSETPATKDGAAAAQIEMVDAGVNADYANFCRLSGTPEELLIDFGLNPQPVARPPVPVAVSHRVITNWYTAKRLLYVLHMTIQRHEATFGSLELDIEKRVVNHPGQS